MIISMQEYFQDNNISNSININTNKKKKNLDNQMDMEAKLESLTSTLVEYNLD